MKPRILNMYEVTGLRLVSRTTMLTGPNLAGTVKAPLNPVMHTQNKYYVGIAEHQRVWKQDSDDSIQQLSIQTSLS